MFYGSSSRIAWFPLKASPIGKKAARSTGELPETDDLADLREQLRLLKLSNEAKDVENRNLHQQLADAQEQLHAAQAAMECHNEGPGTAAADDDVLGDEALRKRLQRLCERKKNGCHDFQKSATAGILT